MSTGSYCKISASIFAAVAVLHIARLVNGWSFAIGPFAVPTWVSGAGAVIALVLAISGFRASK